VWFWGGFDEKCQKKVEKCEKVAKSERKYLARIVAVFLAWKLLAVNPKYCDKC